jgi:LmbE family N-acetylglucosaminyl deacetylase
MRVLYVFAHPDDESYGPAHAMSSQRRPGHQVLLLTLTRGGATRRRCRPGYSIGEMGRVRYQEMKDVAQLLDLSGMTVLPRPTADSKRWIGGLVEWLERNLLWKNHCVTTRSVVQ